MVLQRVRLGAYNAADLTYDGSFASFTGTAWLGDSLRRRRAALWRRQRRRRVDVNDLTIVLTNFGKSGGTWSQGCMDGDPTGTVDINDLTIVLANFGQTAGSTGNAIVAVPEPSALVLISLGVLGLVAGVCRRRRFATDSFGPPAD